MEFLTPYIKPREIRIKLAASNIKNEFDIKPKMYDDSLLDAETSTASNKLSTDDSAGNTKIDQ